MSDHDEPIEPSASLTAKGARDEPTEPSPSVKADDARDEPTDLFGAVTAEVVTADEPEPDAEPEPEPPKQSVFAAVNARRVSIALVVIALVWLGVWAYTSDSAATSSSGTVATAAPPATSPAKAGRGQGHHRNKGATTTLAPPANLARTPEAFATALVGDWQRHDRADALRVATLKAVNHLFSRRLIANEQVIAQGCRAAGTVTNCTWASQKRQIVLQVQNPTGSSAPRVVAVTVRRL